MKRYFINPELKISSTLIITIMAVFLFFNCLILETYHDNLKKDYIKSLGAITARVVEKDPALTKDIIPMVTKEISNDEAIKGKEILNRYGIDEGLEDSLFPYMRETVARDDYSIAFIFIIMAAVFFIINYIQHAYFYKKIRSLTLAAKKVVDGDYEISINEDREGDLSKLANSFNSMRQIIRNNINDLEKEKKFLVDLLSDISHQLKTPLSSMVVYNDILLEKEISEEQRRTLLLSNQNQLSRMTWLIQSILKLARLDAKAIQFDKENLSLNETIQESIDALESKALQNNIKINFKEKAEVFFVHDSLWLEEALMNIIKNAIEHTNSGGEINIELWENPVYKRIVICDTGEGINEDDLPNIFKRFYRTKNSKKSDAIGIGLALAKSIIESHSGSIEAKSKVGVGTKFIITFDPRVQATEKAGL